MILDAQLTYSDAQALAATAASTNVIDHGSARALGVGEPLAVVITTDVALAGTTPTLVIALQTDSVVGFGSLTTVATTQSYSAFAIGTRIAMTLPADRTVKRFTRLNYTLGGTTPTVTLTASLVPLKDVQAENVFAGAFTVL